MAQIRALSEAPKDAIKRGAPIIGTVATLPRGLTLREVFVEEAAADTLATLPRIVTRREASFEEAAAIADTTNVGRIILS